MPLDKSEMSWVKSNLKPGTDCFARNGAFCDIGFVGVCRGGECLCVFL